ncbi:MAG: PD40 domain-containing protein [Lentisphaeria bacterium]|nr:PD40 domain-containing protein [Lentisphaeria bacterium]
MVSFGWLVRGAYAVALATLAVTAVSAQVRRAPSQIDVSKRAAEADPVLALAQFEGDAAVRRHFEETLRRCGWFVVGGDAAEADYVVSARHLSGGQETLAMQVTATKRAELTSQVVAPAGQTEVLVYRAVDELLRRLFAVPGLCDSRIAFAVAGAGNLKEIYTCRFDGRDAQRLSHNGSISTEPSWGPDCRYLVYTLYTNNATSVVLVDMENRRQRTLSRFAGLNAGADISPDGQWVALTLSKERRVDLYLLSVQTGDLRQVTRDLAVESSPCWSPRGDQLCYVSDRAGQPQLHLVSTAGGGPARLLSEREEAVSPDWSPVSNQICFATRLGGQYVIGVVDMSGGSAGGRRIVTRAAGDWESPSWAPDGRHLVCSRGTGGRRELFLVDSRHGKLVAITQNGNHSLPSWSSLY